MDRDWDLFLAPYDQAVKELKIKLRGIRTQYCNLDEHNPIEFVTGRVKSLDSILEKCNRRKINVKNIDSTMYDIAGVRIMCQFVEDVFEVIELIKQRKDLTVVKEVDYLSYGKNSGYRSYHIIVKYPIYWHNQEKEVYVEIQIRTLAMNFWSTIEHSLNYKYQGDYPNGIKQRLKNVARAAYLLDEEMSSIRSEVIEAKSYYNLNQNKGE